MGTLLHCWWECKLVQPLWKPVWRFLRKLKIELPYDPAIALLGIYPSATGVLMHGAWDESSSKLERSLTAEGSASAKGLIVTDAARVREACVLTPWPRLES